MWSAVCRTMYYKVSSYFYYIVVMRVRTTDLKLAPFPNSLAATRRGFTFYLAVPISSIHR